MIMIIYTFNFENSSVIIHCTLIHGMGRQIPANVMKGHLVVFTRTTGIHSQITCGIWYIEENLSDANHISKNSTKESAWKMCGYRGEKGFKRTSSAQIY